MADTTTQNSTLIAEVIDQLATYDRPIATSTLSMAATSIMRRAVNRGVVKKDDVMTWNSLGYWEVTGATVAAILAKRADVSMTGKSRRDGSGRVERHWALTVNAERWAKREEERQAALVAADTRFVIHEPDGFANAVRVIDTTRVGRVSTVAETVVASFDAEAIPIDVARDLAARVKRVLVRQAVVV